jgi:hypothetical protein
MKMSQKLMLVAILLLCFAPSSFAKPRIAIPTDAIMIFANGCQKAVRAIYLWVRITVWAMVFALARWR